MDVGVTLADITAYADTTVAGAVLLIASSIGLYYAMRVVVHFIRSTIHWDDETFWD